MDEEISRIVQAVQVAALPPPPGEQDRAIHTQAVNYLAQIQENAGTDAVWRLALTLFIDTENGTANRKYDSNTRFFALRLLEEFLDNKYTPLDDASFQLLKDSFIGYIRSEYIYGLAESSAKFLRNKFSHTFSLFFLSSYQTQWPTFFSDLFELIRSVPTSRGAMPSSSAPSLSLNPHICILFLRTVLEISGEISDQLLKSARAFLPERHARDARVRDLVRERDARVLNDAVIGIIQECLRAIDDSRKDLTGNADVSSIEEIVGWGVKAFASYIHWVDISLTCTPTTIQLLFSLLSSSETAAHSVRLSTVLALQRMIAKGLKEPSDKLELLRVLDMGKVLGALEERTRQTRLESGEEEDEELEQFREALGKLLSVLAQELLDLTREEVSEVVKLPAAEMIEELKPVALKFLADDFDDTSSTIFPFVHNLLSTYKKVRKAQRQLPFFDNKGTFLQELLEVLLQKLRWDAADDPLDMDEDDLDHFETLRRDIRVFLESIHVLEPEMVTNAIFACATNYFSVFEAQGPSIVWVYAELAVYLVLIYGDVVKGPARGRWAFCMQPPSEPSAPRTEKIRKADVDYSQYELTQQGRLMLALFKSNIVSFPHPHSAVAMQVYECTIRYPDFFKVRKECIPVVLEAIIDGRGIHHSHHAVRRRTFYLFHRFLKDQRLDITPDLAATALNAIADTLVVDVEMPNLAEDSELPEDSTLGEWAIELANRPTLFHSQVYMFEAAGTLISLLWQNPESQQNLFANIVQPIIADMHAQIQFQRNNPNAAPKDAAVLHSILRVNHDIIVLGNIAKGFPELPAVIPEGYILPPIVVFQQCMEAILVALDEMNKFKVIRDAARSSFTKAMATAGAYLARYIPEFMSRLIQQFEATELIDFLNFIGLLVHKISKEMFDVVDELMVPLHTHIAALTDTPAAAMSDLVTRGETKKSYLLFLSNVVATKLQGVFTSERNKGHLETLLQFVMSIAQDVSDPTCEKAAIIFLSRCVTMWAQLPAQQANVGTAGTSGQSAIPGFERFVYENIVPIAFKLPSLPTFDIKDGQMVLVCNEIAGLILNICKTRGDEAYEYLATVYLPNVQCPPETAQALLHHLKDQDGKGFKKYFVDFIKASKATQAS